MLKNNGYTVKHSIENIDEICENPERFLGEIQGALNDARTHYENHNVSKQWYDSVLRILTECNEIYGKK